MGFEQTNTTTTNGDKVKKPKRDKKGRHSTTASPRGSIVKPNKKKKNGQKADSFNQVSIEVIHTVLLVCEGCTTALSVREGCNMNM